MNPFPFACAVTCVVGILQAFSPASLLAEEISLREPFNDKRSYQVNVQVSAKGKLKTPVKEDAAAELPLDVQAQLVYKERRLPSAGRDDRAFRSIRHYEQASSKIVVKDQTTQLQLSPYAKEIIAEGDRSGLWLYAQETPLQRRDIDLLSLPGDALSTIAALPTQDLEVGAGWTAPEWAAQMFSGVEAATSTKLTGKLLSHENNIATLELTGEVSGATNGALTKVTLKGTAQFDTKEQYLKSLKLTQKEERGISTVSPGMEVEATVEWTRKILPSGGIEDSRLQDIPFDPPAYARLLQFHSRYWNISLTHDRHWHMFQEIPEVTVLRLVESGSLISQCNVARIPKMKPGTHVSPQKFEDDIKTSLGEQFSQIIDTQEIPTENGNFIFRVVAAGGSNDLQMVWIYYLCAHPDGRQISFVFAVEQNNLEALNSRDLAIVESLQFGS